MESLHVSQGSGQESHLETPTGQASGSQHPSCREEGTGLPRPPKGSQHIPHAKRKTEKPGLQFLRPLLCCPQIRLSHHQAPRWRRGPRRVEATGQAKGSPALQPGWSPAQRPPARASTSLPLGGAPAALKGKAEGLAHSRWPSNGPQADTTVTISASAQVKKSVLSNEKCGWLLFLT